MSKEAKAYHHKWIGDEKDLRDRYEVMQDYAEKYHKEQLLLHNVSGSCIDHETLMEELDDKRVVGVEMNQNMWDFSRKETTNYLLSKYKIIPRNNCH